MMPRPAARTLALLAALVTPLAFAAQPSACNPIVDPDWRGCGALTRDLERAHDRALERRFVRCLGAYGFARFDDGARARLAAQAARFESLIVASQRPPYLPDESLVKWFRPLASPAGREGLAQALLAWLGPGAPSPLDADGFLQLDVALGRQMAAEALADIGDTRAIPLLRDLVEPAVTVPWDWSWGSELGYRRRLELALLRLEDPRRAECLGIDSMGTVEVHRSLDDLDQARLAVARNEFRQDEFPVPAGEIRKLWNSLEGAPASPLGRAPSARRAIVLRFTDGLAVRFWLLGPDTVACDDNSHLAPGSDRLFVSQIEGKFQPTRPTAVISRSAYDEILRLVAEDRGLSPRPEGPLIPRELRLPFLRALTHDRNDANERRFITMLGRRDFQRVEAEARTWLGEHFDRFAPLVLRAQQPYFMPDRPLIDWTLARATPAQRETLIQQLLSWLSADPGVDARHDGGWDFDRALAAHVLADLGEVRAAPKIRALLDGRDVRNEHHLPKRLWLTQSMLRLVDSSKAGFLVHDGSSGVVLRRSFEEVARVWYGWMGPDETLSAAEARHVWELLAASRSSGSHCTGHGPYGVRIQFRDSLDAEVLLSDRGELCYQDVARPGSVDGWTGIPYARITHRPRLRLESPALVALLGQIRDRAKVPR